MRDLYELTSHRDVIWEMKCGMAGDGRGGCFHFIRNGVELNVIASAGGGWDHLSISVENRCPTWGEMEHVRKQFSLPHEIWIQFGLPERDHINCHPYCLHWWRPMHREVKLPPPAFVGPKVPRGLAAPW